MQGRPSTVHRLLREVIALASAKILRVPKPFRVFGVHEIEDAFRLFQSGRNSGKMAIEMRKEDPVHVSAPQGYRLLLSMTDLLPPDCP